MKNVHPWILFAVLVTSLSFTSLTQGASIDVLWYTYAHPDSRYRQDISRLSRIVHTLPQSKGTRWNLTFWDAGSVIPDLARFDVLVIESGEAFLTGPPDGPLAMPDYRGILDNRAAIEAARGDRIFITGADSDFHAIRGDTGNIPDDSGAPDGGVQPAGRHARPRADTGVAAAARPGRVRARASRSRPYRRRGAACHFRLLARCR